METAGFAPAPAFPGLGSGACGAVAALSIAPPASAPGSAAGAALVAPAPPGPGASTDDKLSFIIENMALKNQTASKTDVTASEVRIMKATKNFIKEEISASVDPLKDEMAELRGRLSAVEVRTRSSSGSLSKQKIQLINSVDIANRQIALTGFSAALSLDSRTKEIEQFLSTFENLPKYTIGHFMQGPRNAQTVSKASYVEFGSEVDRNHFFERSKNVDVKFASGTVKVRKAKTKFNKHRDWALLKATDVLKTAAPGKSVQLDFKNRIVKVGDAKAFEQSSTDFEGVFVHPFSSLSLE